MIKRNNMHFNHIVNFYIVIGSTLGTLTVATGVAGIITPGTFETSESVERSSNEAGAEIEQAAADIVIRQELGENVRGGIDVPTMDGHTEVSLRNFFVIDFILSLY